LLTTSGITSPCLSAKRTDCRRLRRQASRRSCEIPTEFRRNSVAERLLGTDMPDDLCLPVPRRNPEDIDLGRIQSDLKFLIERASKPVRHGGQTVSVAHKLPTRQELAYDRSSLSLLVRSAGLVIAWIELFRPVCL
jgi:hypothetical protein